jgi:pimeloyl-ACP methyl ester carboxylesterase
MTSGKSTEKVKTHLETSNGSFALYRLKVEALEGNAAQLEQCQVDVLLLHGLTGHFMKTWGGQVETAKGQQQKKGDGMEGIVSDCWPCDLAIEHRSRATFWTLGYPAPLFESHATQESIKEEAKKALALLVEANFGKKPIIFVAHSLGGLLAKAILVESSGCENNSAAQQVFENTTAVIFAGTPHAGSYQTKWRFLVPTVLGWAAKGIGFLAGLAAVGTVGGAAISVQLLGLQRTISLTATIVFLATFVTLLALGRKFTAGSHLLRLDPDNPTLRDLKQTFRSAYAKRSFQTVSFFERKSLWHLFLIVPSWSADPGLTDSYPEGIEADHIRMCKSRSGPLQRAVKQCLDDACRGKNKSVFGTKLENLIKKKEKGLEGQLRVLRGESNGDLATAKRSLRIFLRRTITELGISSAELQLALNSKFFEDELVWDMWHEHTLVEVLRSLQRRAAGEVCVDSKKFLRGGTLIALHRSLRTIEHVCSGDLTDPGENKLDREVLLQFVQKATEMVQEKIRDKEQWTDDGGTTRLYDEGGSTRRLLLRMESSLLAIHEIQRCVGKSEMSPGVDITKMIEQKNIELHNALNALRAIDPL